MEDAVSGIQFFNPDGRLRGSYVYLMLCAEQERIFVKAGRSNSPLQRLNDLRVGCPLIPEILAVAEVANVSRAKRLENHLHRGLHAWHSHGEWFVLTRAQKFEFNSIIWSIVREHSDPSRRIAWRQYSVPALIRDAQRRRTYAQSRFAKLGQAFRDFKTVNR